MSDQPDAAEAADMQAIDRLDRALDRIAALVREVAAQAMGAGDSEQPHNAELRARLDRLVATLRAALAATPDSGGGNGSPNGGH